jgi:hypothetical protein
MSSPTQQTQPAALASSAAADAPTQQKQQGFVQVTSGGGSGEPDLMNVCQNTSDQMTLRNILYSLWALNKGGGGGQQGIPNCYLV